jgi:hypothetical protein
MKKILLAVLVLSVLILAPAFAEETQKDAMPGMTLDKPMGMPMSGMGKMCCPMMGKTQMVATDEGGVIVLAGNKLMKYDADLNLVKEVEVKIPMGPMGGKQCPMMGKRMDENATPGASDSQEKTAS